MQEINSDCCNEEHHHHENHHEEHHHHQDADCHDHEGCACEADILENIDKEKKQSKKPLIIFSIGILIFLIGFSIETFLKNNLIGQVFFLIVVVFVGHNIINYGIRNLIKGKVKIEFLVTIATIGAFLLGSGEEGAILVLLFYLAEYLEHYALDRSKKSLVSLVKLTPETGVIKKDSKEIEVNVDEIKLEDIVVVKPGDKIPIDGVIIKGSTSVNQSSITGESIGINRTVGDKVYASTINEEGYVEIKVTKTSNETIFSKIINLIKSSQEKKAKVDIFIDEFAEIYTPIIVILAILVAVLPTLLFNEPIKEWTYRSLVLLVISCPCALAISTPVSMVSAITKGTKNGIIIKGGEYIEELSKIKAVLFDKTGTLTEGKVEISNISPIENHSKIEIMEIACSLESKSKHPIANAFNEYKINNKLNLKEVVNFKSLPGKGLVGDINNETYYIGKSNLFNNVKNEDEKNTIVYVGTEKELLGKISLKDKIREDSESTIKKLKSFNIKSMMITGDNPKTAKSVANKLGIDDYYSDLLPTDKVEIVEKNVEKYKNIVMVGDGVNDAPSLARSNVGIAMGLDGADVAIETGDIVLLEDKLSKIALLIKLAKRTMSKIKQNVVLCILVKGALAIFAILGFVTLWEAILIGDMGLTLIVVGNALLLAK